MQAKKRAEEARNGAEIAYYVPREGALMWFDAFAIPKDAPTRRGPRLPRLHDAPRGGGGQHQLRVLRQRQRRGPQVREAGDPGKSRHLPDEATLQRLSSNTAWDDRTQRFVTRNWTRVRTGR